MPEAKGRPQRSSSLESVHLQGVQNLTSILTLWSHRITNLSYVGRDNIQDPKGAKGPSSKLPTNIFLTPGWQGWPFAQLKVLCKLPSLLVTQRRQGALVINSVQRLTQEQEDLGMVIWGHQMLMASLQLLPRSLSLPPTFQGISCTSLSAVLDL